MRKIVAAALIAAGVVGGGTARAATIESKLYVGLTADVSQQCTPAGLPGAGVGGACFDVSGGTVHILIDDAITNRTAFQVRFYGAAGGIGERIPGCGDLSLSVPDSATMMRVFVGLTRDCPDGTTGGLGTVGFLTVVK